jgi:hypothetical protein
MTHRHPAPIGDARLNRQLRNQALDTHNAQTLARIAQETGGNIAHERERKVLARGLGDLEALRGIPAIGRGVNGEIRGTRP